MDVLNKLANFLLAYIKVIFIFSALVFQLGCNKDTGSIVDDKLIDPEKASCQELVVDNQYVSRF